MNVGKTTPSLGVAYSKNNSADKIQELERRKKQLTQELKRVKESPKGGKAQSGEVEKRAKELSNQINSIDEQIAALKNQKQSSSDKVKDADGLQKDNLSDDITSILPEARRFDEYIKSDDEPDKPDITYRVVSEDGKLVVKFNKGHGENNKQPEALDALIE